MNTDQPQPEQPPSPADDVALIDRLCDQFEEAWKARQVPRIEDYLGQIGQSAQPALLRELLLLELDYRGRAGEQPTAEEYRARFPDHASVVDAVFQTSRLPDAPDAPTDDCPPPAPADPDMTQSAAVHVPLAGQQAIRIRCPHCRHPVEIGDDRPLAETTCPSCGGKFTLATVKTLDGHGGTAVAVAFPKMIGHFELLGLLGAGGFGTVWKARDKKLDRFVAVKTPRQGKLRPEEVEKFLREARTAAQLQHRGLVAVYDVQEQQGTPYIVQEFVDGQDLAKWTGQRPVESQAAAQVLREVADAVDFAHRRGFVHRDLKPANILIDAAGHPHVADFGLALHEADQWSHKGEVSGSPAYMSPEQIRGEAQYIDGRSDLWSLGVILYELLTGRRPFTATSSTDLRNEILEREPRPPRMVDGEIPPELERIVLKCLAKRVADRYATARDLAQDLDGYLHPPPTRRRLVVAAIASVMAVAVVAGALLAWLPQLGKPPASGPGVVPVPTPAPLLPMRIESVEIQQLTLNAENEHERSGLVLHDPYRLRLEDGVQFRARLSRPAYCYWIAFRPDGVEELCFPKDPGQSPPLTDTPIYPVENPDEIIYALTDGIGMQAFVLVVSETPLPAYREWRKSLPPAPWEPSELQNLAAVFHHDGRWEESFPLDGNRQTRGAGERRRGGQSPLDGLAGWVRGSNQGAAIEAWALPVLPREGHGP